MYVGGRWRWSNDCARRWGTAAILLAAFIGARALLIVHSYDSVANWEEPVFLFSGVDLGNQGLIHLFDYQDDLSHGGSVPLVLIAAPWVRIVGWRLDALKGIELLWSAATVMALLAVGTRFVSLRFGVLLVLLYAASPNAALLQVTLVGSHPEAVLLMVLALAAYLRALEPRHDGNMAAALLGAACALTTWCSYLTVPFTACLGAFFVARRPRRAIAAFGGAIVGFSPWILQNMVLRPHGAMQWTERTGQHSPPAQAHWSVLASAAESLGGGVRSGSAALAILTICAVWALLASLRGDGERAARAYEPRAVLPVACGAVLFLAALAAAKPAMIPGEGFYYFRYFVPLQLLLFWLAALGIDEITRRFGSVVFYGAAVVVLAFALATQLPLYRGANSYVPNRERDFDAGCAVYGHGEVDRAASDEDAVARLETFADSRCKRAAFTGYGWGVVSRYVRNGDGALLAASLDSVRDPALHADACDSARRLMTNLYEGAMSPDRRHTGAMYVESACARR